MIRKGRVLSTICAGLLILTVAACATTQEVRTNTRVPTMTYCPYSRLEVISKYFAVGYLVIEDCRNSDSSACILAPILIPWMTFVAGIMTPVLLPALLWDPCLGRGTTATETSGADEQL